MNSTHLPALGSKCKVLATLTLALLALAGNYFSLPLLFGVSYIFGSIAVMLAVMILGIVPAVLVAVVGGLYTLELWGHPYALLIFTAEALFVGLLRRYNTHNLVLADLTYWLVIGVPLIFLFYRGILEIEWNSVGVIALKQPLNALFNTLLATLIILGLQIHWPSAQKAGLGTVRLTSLVFHVILTLNPVCRCSTSYYGELQQTYST